MRAEQPSSKDLAAMDQPRRSLRTSDDTSDSLVPVEKDSLRRLQPSGLPSESTNLSRRRREALLMAGVALLSLAYRRMGYDHLMIVSAELLLGGLLVFLVGRFSKTTATAAAIILPWILDVVGRTIGAGNGMEIVMLSSLAWGAVTSAAFGTTRRTISLSVVCSGFLTLFAAFIADSLQATWFAYAWGGLCLWWLISNHWEEVQSQSATHVKSMRGYRLVSLALGCLVFAVLTYSLANRVPVLRKLQQELMPTSGGTSQKDSVGRGVGNGDTLIAAQNHPTSFGAVETDIFLESTKPSLFDVVSEEVGPPKRNRRVERAQSLQGTEAQVNFGRYSEANQSSGNSDFSTNRSAPRNREKPKDIIKNSLMFWAGRPAAHLVVERFTEFDGVSWTNPQALLEKSSMSTPESIELEDQHWFFASKAAFPNDHSPFVDAVQEAVKFTRFRSPVLPTPVGVQMWSIDMLDRADFFAIDGNGVLSMPDRLHVPDYTVVRLVNSRIDLECVERLLRDDDGLSSASNNISGDSSAPNLPRGLASRVSKLAAEIAGQQPRGWDQVSAVIHYFRQRYTCDAEWTPPLPIEEMTPVEQFLEHRRGPSYLIASAAALVLKDLGYDTRLAMGFYADPKNRFSRDNEIAILPGNAHVWPEIHLGNGYWISLEPTSGFQAEKISVGLWYRIKRAKTEILMAACLAILFGLAVFMGRGYVLELTSKLLWPLASMVSDRRRIAWLARLLDLRTRLAGHPRDRSQVLREHFRGLAIGFPEQLAMDLQRFLSASDKLYYGFESTLTSDDRLAARRVWQQLTFFQLRRISSG